jgi:monoamine oxidase
MSASAWDRSPFVDEWHVESTSESFPATGSRASLTYGDPGLEALDPGREELDPELEGFQSELEELDPELEELGLEALERPVAHHTATATPRPKPLPKPAPKPRPSAPPPPVEEQECENAILGQKMRDLARRELWPTTEVIAKNGCPEKLKALKVAVVGGGLGGLTAAWYLKQFGVQVTLFEASDRLGGRVWSDYRFVDGRVVERGAELIGSNHPMWWLLAKRYGLNLVELTTTEDYEQRQRPLEVRVRLDDDFPDRRALWSEIDKILHAIARDAEHIDPFNPWKKLTGAPEDPKHWDNMTIADKVGSNPSQAVKFFKFLVNNDDYAPAENQSYLGLLAKVSAGRMGADKLGYWHCRETHKCADGNQVLAERIADELREYGRERVATNRPVKEITVNANGVHIDYRGSGAKDFAYVVLAVPPTAWDKELAIGPDFNKALYTMAHGKGAKFLGAFDTPFWEQRTRSGSRFHGLAPSGWWNQLGQVWESTDKQPPGKRGYALCTYVGGTMADRHDAPYYEQMMGRFYKDYTSLAKRTQLTDWSTMKWIHTGASCPGRGQVTTVGERLSMPFKGRMFFAGEHACVPFHAYMEGALQSGARAGNDIIKAVCGQRGGLIRTA